MKKIVLMFNLFATLLFSFSFPLNDYSKNNKISATLMNDKECKTNDSVVTITTANNLISVSGVIIDEDENYVYIATSYANYNQAYHYEIVLNDYTRAKAFVVGYTKEDEVLLLKSKVDKYSYCVANISKSEYIDLYEFVDIRGKANYKDAVANGEVTLVGVCRNCQEETYRNYYYTLITGEVDNYLIGAGVFDKTGGLLGIVLGREDKFKLGIRMLDITKLYSICYNLINYGKYEKNYIKYNLLDVNSLTNYQKYLYSLDEGVTRGVLVGSIHYLNYIIGGLNQGMIILSVNNVKVDNCYELDNELSKYIKGSVVSIKARTITNSYKTYRIKL